MTLQGKVKGAKPSFLVKPCDCYIVDHIKMRQKLLKSCDKQDQHTFLRSGENFIFALTLNTICKHRDK